MSMVDFRFIGEKGLIIQYEDIVTMIGFNVVRYLYSKDAIKLPAGTSIQDVLVDYINRTEENPERWLKEKFNINFKVENYLDSINTLQPILLYSYKMFNASNKEGINTLIIHSNEYSPVIKEFIHTYDLPKIEYTHGDILPVLQTHPNATFTTASIENIKRCKDVTVPLCLVIAEDYGYISNIISDKIDEELRKKDNIYVCFTRVLSGGFIT